MDGALGDEDGQLAMISFRGMVHADDIFSQMDGIEARSNISYWNPLMCTRLCQDPGAIPCIDPFIVHIVAGHELITVIVLASLGALSAAPDFFY